MARAAPPDGSVITDRLARSALWAALTTDPVDQIIATLRQVGFENARDGMPNACYISVGHALMHAARERYPGDWTGYMSSGWAGYVQWMNAHFLFGASRVPRAPEPAPQPAPAAGRPRRRMRTLDEEDEEDGAGFGHLMVSMTRNRKDKPPKR